MPTDSQGRPLYASPEKIADICAEYRQEKARKAIMACPACSAVAYYIRDVDRYFHADGSSNRPCWRAITRGEAGR
jgi:hypothetical protein